MAAFEMPDRISRLALTERRAFRDLVDNYREFALVPLDHDSIGQVRRRIRVSRRRWVRCFADLERASGRPAPEAE